MDLLKNHLKLSIVKAAEKVRSLFLTLPLLINSLREQKTSQPIAVFAIQRWIYDDKSSLRYPYCKKRRQQAYCLAVRAFAGERQSSCRLRFLRPE